MAVNVESPNTTSENISFTIESGVKFQNLSFEFDNEIDNTEMSSIHVEGECDNGSSVIQEGNEIKKNRTFQWYAKTRNSDGKSTERSSFCVCILYS